MNIKQGDYVRNKRGDRRRVLGVCGEIVFLSEYSDTSFPDWEFKTGSGGWYSESDLKTYGYSVETPKKSLAQRYFEYLYPGNAWDSTTKDSQNYWEDQTKRLKKLFEEE